MEISVEQRHIDDAVPCSHYCCPVALAAREQYAPQLAERPVKVDGRSLYMAKARYSLPDNAIRWIDRFDHGKIVRPFTFEV